MSIFGDFETPAAKKSEAPAKQLAELSIRPHTTWQADEGSPVVPIVQGILDKPTSKVHLRVEAKTAFSDGTAGDGVRVAFFLNGNRLGDVETDDFGLGTFNDPIPAGYFTMNLLTDELTARVRGFAKEASVRVTVHRKQIRLRISHRWQKAIPKPSRGPYHIAPRYENLHMEIAGEAFPQGLFAASGTQLMLQRCVDGGCSWETLACSTLDATGKCIVALPRHYFDYDEWCQDQRRQERIIPENLAYSRCENGYAVRVIPVGWPIEEDLGVYSDLNRISAHEEHHAFVQ
jgi:hypothetical protein